MSATPFCQSQYVQRAVDFQKQSSNFLILFLFLIIKYYKTIISIKSQPKTQVKLPRKMEDCF